MKQIILALILLTAGAIGLQGQTIRPTFISQLRLTQLTTAQEGTMTLQDGDQWYNSTIGCYRKRISGANFCVSAGPVVPIADLYSFGCVGDNIAVENTCTQDMLNFVRSNKTAGYTPPGAFKITTSIDASDLTNITGAEEGVRFFGAGSGRSIYKANLAAAFPVLDFIGSQKMNVHDIQVFCGGSETAGIQFARENTSLRGDAARLQNVWVECPNTAVGMNAVSADLSVVEMGELHAQIPLVLAGTDIETVGTNYGTFAASTGSTTYGVRDSILIAEGIGKPCIKTDAQYLTVIGTFCGHSASAAGTQAFVEHVGTGGFVLNAFGARMENSGSSDSALVKLTGIGGAGFGGIISGNGGLTANDSLIEGGWTGGILYYQNGSASIATNTFFDDSAAVRNLLLFNAQGWADMNFSDPVSRNLLILSDSGTKFTAPANNLIWHLKGGVADLQAQRFHFTDDFATKPTAVDCLICIQNAKGISYRNSGDTGDIRGLWALGDNLVLGQFANTGMLVRMFNPLSMEVGAGNAPFVNVNASSTKVANLDADKLDGGDWTSGKAMKIGASGTTIQEIRAFTFAWNPASVAANTSVEQTVTVTGLPVNAHCISITKPSATAGIVVGGCRVSAADTLAVVFGNLTAGAVDPPNETYVLWAID